METFSLFRADTVEDAVALHGGAPGTRYLAGGTNLLDLMKLGVEAPTRLVDISRLPLDSVEETSAGGLLVGALVSNTRLAAHPLVRERYPLASQAIVAGASGQLRNMASVGGNLLQRTRCHFFIDTSRGCNRRDPGSGCAALGHADNTHAVLGGSSSCIAAYPGDLAAALLALDALVVVTGRDGERTVPIEELHRLPQDAPQIETVLRPSELITAVVLPPPPPGRVIYQKVRERRSYAFAIVSVAAVLEVAEDRVRSVRLALGGVASTPWRMRRAEAALLGGPTTEAAFVAAADAELEVADGSQGNGFKIELARRSVTYALRRLARPGGA